MAILHEDSREVVRQEAGSECMRGSDICENITLTLDARMVLSGDALGHAEHVKYISRK